MARYLGFEATNKKTGYTYLSYNSEDVDRIIPIMEELKYKGYDFWYDNGIPHGKDWERILAEKIRDSSNVLMFITRGILDKKDSFVYKEYEIAKKFHNKKIFIVLLDDIRLNEIPEDKQFWWIEVLRNQNIESWRMESTKVLGQEILKALGEKETQISEKSIKKPKAIILEESSDLDIPATPTNYWLLRLFFVVLVDAKGNKYLPLQYPHYNGIWSVPHIAYQLQSPRFKRPKTVDTIIDYMNNGIEGLDDLFLEFEYEQYYQMGMFNNESEEYTKYTEYKTSPTLKDRFNCYRVEEHHITYIDPNEMINLYDPEHLHGYRYLPLDASGKPNFNSPFVDLQEGEVYFFGKPLSSNITRALQSRRLDDCTYQLPEEILLNEYGYYESSD